MRLSLRLLANPIAFGSTNGLKPAPLALLPPIPLYRRLLRAHRKYLVPQMRLLGDQYIKSEFRSHRDTENPMHIIGFLTEWQMYAQNIEGGSWRGEKIDKGKIDKMSGIWDSYFKDLSGQLMRVRADQQLGQFYELMQAIQKQAHEDGGEES
ncbi:MAG: acetate non-utilizing protein 9 [Alectoria sarmentosa]|nr:MAG: acetate non-utilizing protein 9 [Alectoria sarmentosa]